MNHRRLLTVQAHYPSFIALPRHNTQPISRRLHVRADESPCTSSQISNYALWQSLFHKAEGPLRLQRPSLIKLC